MSWNERLSAITIQVDAGRRNSKAYGAADLNEKDRSRNDYIRANLRILERLPAVPATNTQRCVGRSSLVESSKKSPEEAWLGQDIQDIDDSRYSAAVNPLRHATMLFYKFYFARAMCDPRNPLRFDRRLFLEIAKLGHFYTLSETTSQVDLYMNSLAYT